MSKSKLFLLLLSLLPPTAVPVIGQQQPPKATDQQLKRLGTLIQPIVVHIEARYGFTKDVSRQDHFQMNVGTGFFIDREGDIATAAHVICRGIDKAMCVDNLPHPTSKGGENLDDSTIKDIQIFIRYMTQKGDYSENVSAAVLEVDDEEDVAILRPKFASSRGYGKDPLRLLLKKIQIPTLFAGGLIQNQVVRADGFPVTQASLKLQFPIEHSFLIVTQPAYTRSNGEKQIGLGVPMGEGEIAEGYSGGPVTDIATAKIVAVMTRGKPRSPADRLQIASATSIDYVLSLLNLVHAHDNKSALASQTNAPN